MDELINMIMGSSTSLDVYVAIRLAVVFAILEMIKSICCSISKGVRG